MTHVDKIAKVLARNTKTPMTAAMIAKKTGIPRQSVYKRIHDLRVLEGRTVRCQYRTVNGRRKTYYSIAA